MSRGEDSTKANATQGARAGAAGGAAAMLAAIAVRGLIAHGPSIPGGVLSALLCLPVDLMLGVLLGGITGAFLGMAGSPRAGQVRTYALWTLGALAISASAAALLSELPLSPGDLLVAAGWSVVGGIIGATLFLDRVTWWRLAQPTLWNTRRRTAQTKAVGRVRISALLSLGVRELRLARCSRAEATSLVIATVAAGLAILGGAGFARVTSWVVVLFGAPYDMPPGATFTQMSSIVYGNLFPYQALACCAPTWLFVLLGLRQLRQPDPSDSAQSDRTQAKGADGDD